MHNYVSWFMRFLAVIFVTCPSAGMLHFDMGRVEEKYYKLGKDAGFLGSLPPPPHYVTDKEKCDCFGIWL